MDTTIDIDKAKKRMDGIFARLEELEQYAGEITDEHKQRLNQQMSDMRKSKETLNDLFQSLLDTKHDPKDHIESAFDQMSTVMSKRIDQIKDAHQKPVQV